jgi:hypothetical protein
MRQLKYCLFFLLVLLVGCASQEPAEISEKNARLQKTTPAQTSAEEDFDPGSISQEVYITTKSNVQSYIEELNRIISGKNYDAWKANLSEAYFNEISSPENLKSLSESPAMKSQKIVLKTPQDYFINVVVPARANSRVDDIEFTGQNRVKVYTISPKNERLRLYELERTGSTWKIIN